MDKSVLLNEKFSAYWNFGLYFSAAVALLTFLLFWNIQNVLWSGIFRLIAFIAFAISVFCLLKVMEGKKQIKVLLTEHSLKVLYLKGSTVVQEDNATLSNIDHIYCEPYSFHIPVLNFTLPSSDTSSFIIKLKNKSEDYFLFDFGGRVIHLEADSGEKLKNFLKAHNLFEISQHPTQTR